MGSWRLLSLRLYPDSCCCLLLGLLCSDVPRDLRPSFRWSLPAFAIFVVFVPAILAGYNAYFVSIITCLFTIAMTLALVSGPSRKSLSAALGCAGGVMVAGILSFFMDHVMKLTGYLNDETMYVSCLMNLLDRSACNHLCRHHHRRWCNHGRCNGHHFLPVRDSPQNP